MWLLEALFGERASSGDGRKSAREEMMMKVCTESQYFGRLEVPRRGTSIL